MDLKRLRELQESLEIYGELDEAEGSYGQTPKAHAAFNALRIKRENTPSKKFSRKSGGKTASVDRALRHTGRSGGYHPDPGKKSPRPDDYTNRQGMTQRDRDYVRQERDLQRRGLTMYDGPNPEGPKGSLPRSAKKRQRQRKTGVSAESYNIYDILITHLLDEGYADDVKNAYCILENMSEDWVLEILDEKFISPFKGRVFYNNPQGLSPAMKAAHKSDELQRTEPGSERQKKQTRRSQQLDRLYHAAKTSHLR